MNRVLKPVLLITVLVLLTSTSCSADILKAHEASLRLYREGNIDGAIELLEKNGIKDIIDEKPDNLTAGAYVTILNNYGFYLSETEDRYKEAIPILERVIELAPNRTVAYLNIGDVYLRLYREKGDRILREKVTEYYGQYLKLLKEYSAIPENIKLFLREISFEKAMEEIKNTVYTKSERSAARNYPDAFFNNFIKDFKRGEYIEFIEPMAESDDIDSVEFNKFFGDKPELLDSILNIEVSSGLPGAAPHQYESRFDYRLYIIDFDNNTENGKEYLFHSGGYLLFGEEFQSDYNYYHLINLNNGDIIDVVSVYNTFDYKTRKRTGNSNGIIKYKGHYFIYEIIDLNESIALYSWDSKNKCIAAVVRFF